ncbi:MAG: hypothetical protein IKB38_06855 [Clostridia bacterium]|nr:hypothetical protein [Clostridia bacterium]
MTEGLLFTVDFHSIYFFAVVKETRFDNPSVTQMRATSPYTGEAFDLCKLALHLTKGGKGEGAFSISFLINIAKLGYL